MSVDIKLGVLPDCFKIANTMRVIKKVDCSDPDNYRQIAIIPVLAKVVEIILKNRKMTWRTKSYWIALSLVLGKNILRHRVIDNIVDALEDDEIFDCVNLDLLKDNLLVYEFRGKVIELLESYLESSETEVS